MNKYQCEHEKGKERTEYQKLDLVCFGCMRAWINRHNEMKSLLEEIAFSRGIVDFSNKSVALLLKIGLLDMKGQQQCEK